MTSSTFSTWIESKVTELLSGLRLRLLYLWALWFLSPVTEPADPELLVLCCRLVLAPGPGVMMAPHLGPDTSLLSLSYPGLTRSWPVWASASLEEASSSSFLPFVLIPVLLHSSRTASTEPPDRKLPDWGPGRTFPLRTIFRREFRKDPLTFRKERRTSFIAFVTLCLLRWSEYLAWSLALTVTVLFWMTQDDVEAESRESAPIIISREWVTMESCLVCSGPWSAVSSWILVTWSPVLAMRTSGHTGLGTSASGETLTLTAASVPGPGCSGNV